MSAPSRIGILTGGGDCPGLNAVIRAVSKPLLSDDVEVFGIEDGFLGLIEDHVRPLGWRDVSNILNVGGTILGSCNKANPARFATGTNPDGTPVFEDVTKTCLETIERHRLEGLVVLGGDGTMSAAQAFVDAGVPVLGVPKTIDNDLVGTDLTFGFQTAVSIATDALDRVHTTAASHHRTLVVEVMGRNAGWIALHAGVASGSDVILMPEIPFTFDSICETVERRSKRGTRYTVICCSEGARPEGGEQIVGRVDPTSPDPIRLGGVAEFVASEVERRTGVESRSVTLGHVQRGGTPTADDRVLSTLFGHAAATRVHAGEMNRMVAMHRGTLTDIDLRVPAGRQRTVAPDHPLVQAARAVQTGLGD